MAMLRVQWSPSGSRSRSRRASVWAGTEESGRRVTSCSSFDAAAIALAPARPVAAPTAAPRAIEVMREGYPAARDPYARCPMAWVGRRHVAPTAGQSAGRRRQGAGVLALEHPERVERVVALDIAPPWMQRSLPRPRHLALPLLAAYQGLLATPILGPRLLTGGPYFLRTLIRA